MADPDPLGEELRSYLEQLGLGQEWARTCRLPWYREAADLVSTEADCFGRPQQLTPGAFAAWTAMKQAASRARVTLHLISAYRSYHYQFGLIRRKLDAGQPLSDILQVHAAPGFSEHHSGRAVDIGTVDCPPLQEEFETTEAFRWLLGCAGHYGFRLSYPRDNPYSIVYEPWHWCFHGLPGEAQGRTHCAGHGQHEHGQPAQK